MDRWLMILLVALLAGCVQPEPVACTADAMLCPDGSAVGRVAPDCGFAECPPVNNTNSSAPLGAPEAISILKANYPEFEGYPNDNLPPQSIRTEKAERGWRVAFVQEGSGVPIIGARCFLVSENKSVQHTGDFKPASADDADFYINNCSSYGRAELPPEPVVNATEEPKGKLLLYLPWTKGEAWRFVTGWHDEDCVDFTYDHGNTHKAVRAAANGTVAWAQHSLASDFNTYQKGSGKDITDLGNFVALDHGNGVYTLYGHFEHEGTPPVKIGDAVKAGQRIGWQGNTGWSHGAHLHFCVVGFEGFSFTKVPRDSWGLIELNGSNDLALEKDYVSQNTPA